MNYKEQLQHPSWIKKRYKILIRDEGKCVRCGEHRWLNIHHIYYVKGQKAWQYPDNALITLCRKCHKAWHDEHELEIRTDIFKKTREYNPPKRKFNKKVTPPWKKKVVVTPLTKKEKGKISAIKNIGDKLQEKAILINSLNITDIEKEQLSIKTNQFNLIELKRYLEYKQLLCPNT